MRLLNTGTLALTRFTGEIPEYAILSHRWEEEELVFDDIMKEPISNTSNAARAKRGFSKGHVVLRPVMASIGSGLTAVASISLAQRSSKKPSTRCSDGMAMLKSAMYTSTIFTMELRAGVLHLHRVRGLHAAGSYRSF
jgi:hypothetical protein